jgi:hypothetical protein
MAPAALECKPDQSAASPTTGSAYRNFVKPEWARLLNLLGMDIMRLFQHHDILSQTCGNNFMVLKVAPPLVITEDQIAQYLDAIEAVMETVHSSASFWSDASTSQRAVRA